MFNLSVTGNVGYNGISQLSESRCTSQFNTISERTSTPGAKMRFSNTSSRSKYSSGYKPSSYLDAKNVSSNVQLQISNAKEDVYTFDDTDTPVITNRLSNSFLKESVLTNKADGGYGRKNSSGSSSMSPKKSPIAKQTNGLNVQKDSVVDPKNGIYKASLQDDPAKNLQSNASTSPRIVVKQNKDLFDQSPFLPNFELESEKLSSNLTDRLNNSTKNSITSFISSKSMKTGLAYGEVKKECASRGSDGLLSSILTSPFKSNAKPVTPKNRIIPSGKPHPNSLKVRKGRGPAVHEALQRINPSSLTYPTKNVVTSKKWHAPGTEMFDCGVLNVFHNKIDSDSSEDYPSDCATADWDSDNLETDDDGDKPSTCTVLRRKITLFQQLEKISEFSKSATAIYNSVKSQMRKQKKSNTSEGFRLEGSTLNALLVSQGLTSVLSGADRRKIRYRSRLVEPVECARPGCGATALACARLCLAHISLNPEQRLFTECTATFSDNTQCRVPVIDVRNELPLCSEHTWKKDNYAKTVQEIKPKKSVRKRPKSSSARPSKKNRKKSPTVGENESNFFNKRDPSNVLSLHDDSQLFASPKIENGTCAGFLNHDDTTELNVCSNSSACESSEDCPSIGGLSEHELMGSSNHNMVDADVVAEVLALHEDLPSLDLVPSNGAPQEPNIDLSTVFNEFFTEQNGEYIPTREETEELERALEAVKSLEKLTNSQNSSSLLDTLLDERTLNETLVGFPDMFNNIPPARLSAGESVDSASLPS